MEHVEAGTGTSIRKCYSSAVTRRPQNWPNCYC